MVSDSGKTIGPDLTQGIPFTDLLDGGMFSGQVGNEPVLLVRQGEDVFAIGALCTHYSGPLAEGLIVGDTIRCPWHHACFSLRSGNALRAPALNPLSCWHVVRQNGVVFVPK
jgi:apoptosis-inducing factor 3